ncbi:MAG: phosphatidylserine decarboxylase family protein [Candidatus Marinimicrobia bacterium]|nr:phosphatidylserine decarboxylase family protein [Candidatus Neomarinimicrobiota bacterium]
MIAKQGHKILIPLLALAILSVILMLLFPFVFLKYLAVATSSLLLFTIWFFRDPERDSDQDRAIVVSPADGRVVAYDEVVDSFVGNAKKISIFMSIFNVHVNRAPDGGEIVSDEHTAGKFMSAYNPAASFENERRRINIQGEGDRRYGVIQIAGLIARRIIPYHTIGAKLKKGERIGMISFGSKVDIVLPADIVVQIKINQKLKAGKTVIGIYK